jgi:hypothetical protein
MIADAQNSPVMTGFEEGKQQWLTLDDAADGFVHKRLDVRSVDVYLALAHVGEGDNGLLTDRFLVGF